ncbi:caspase domain-containing protein [Streptomyces sp. NPDC002870]|uniref:caspase family protein n=1 Tax=Streptomyces sp. NPDC002870 TaxID=3364666 RepID=UPI00368F5ACD
MGRYRALLIGASDYEMRGVQPLPFVPGDLARLGSVLEQRGFQDVQVLSRRADGKQVSANYVNARVIGFLRRARRGDTLFILLSGHGVHARGRDYLVPEDIDEDMHPFESGCVPIDWRQHLDETPAEHVVILIDACREGIDQDSMGVAGVREWGKQKIGAALRRKVAYVYACSPARLSLFVRTHESVPDGSDHGTGPGDSFSLFSRSVSDIVAAHPGTEALALGQFMEAVQDRVTELHRAYRKKGDPQILRVVTDIPSDGFFFLPGGGQPVQQVPRATPVATAVRDGSAMGLDLGGGVLDGSALGTFGPSPVIRPVPPPPASPPVTTAPGHRRSSRIVRGIVGGVLLALVTGGLVGGWQWTRTQYYVGVDDGHVAIYQGVKEKLAWTSLSELEKTYVDIEVKYLPSYQRRQVEQTIAENSLGQARAKVEEIKVQASTCKKEAERRKVGSGGGQSLTEEEQKLVPMCDAS